MCVRAVPPAACSSAHPGLFRQIINSYTPPPQTSLTRHLPTTHLNPQIAHLIRARPLSVSMGTAIRFLKYEISLIEMDMPLEEVRRGIIDGRVSELCLTDFACIVFPFVSKAKSLLISKIDSFIRDRILLASRVIEQHAIEKINDGDVILTYARSSVVEGVLLEAKRQGKEFSVVVVDSRPLYEGAYPSSLCRLKRFTALSLTPGRGTIRAQASTSCTLSASPRSQQPTSSSRPSRSSSHASRCACSARTRSSRTARCSRARERRWSP